jgi:DNA repair protein RecO
MHHIYTTRAFIIRSFPLGEANKGYLFFTKDLGLVRASAQGVRLVKSKLKGHLGVFSYVEISLVKGKEIWRITNVETIKQNPFSKNLEKLGVVKNIFSLLIRLIHGEDKNENLFEAVESFYVFLSEEEISGEKLKNIEVILALRVLYNLGYLKKTASLSEFAENNQLSEGLAESFSGKRQFAVKEINNILKETHL